MGSKLGGEDVIMQDAWEAGEGGRVETFVSVNFAGGHVAMLGNNFVEGRERLLGCMRRGLFDRFIANIHGYSCLSTPVRLFKESK
jgi:hypothetical protein